jgi:hypothetical protein
MTASKYLQKLLSLHGIDLTKKITGGAGCDDAYFGGDEYKTAVTARANALFKSLEKPQEEEEESNNISVDTASMTPIAETSSVVSEITYQDDDTNPYGPEEVAAMTAAIVAHKESDGLDHNDIHLIIDPLYDAAPPNTRENVEETVEEIFEEDKKDEIRPSSPTGSERIEEKRSFITYIKDLLQKSNKIAPKEDADVEEAEDADEEVQDDSANKVDSYLKPIFETFASKMNWNTRMNKPDLGHYFHVFKFLMVSLLDNIQRLSKPVINQTLKTALIATAGAVQLGTSSIANVKHIPGIFTNRIQNISNAMNIPTDILAKLSTVLPKRDTTNRFATLLTKTIKTAFIKNVKKPVVIPNIKQIPDGIDPSYGGGFILFDNSFTIKDILHTGYQDKTIRSIRDDFQNLSAINTFITDLNTSTTPLTPFDINKYVEEIKSVLTLPNT